MILRLATGTVLGAVAVAGAATTLALGTAAVGGLLLARRLCEERKGWQQGAATEAPAEPLEPRLPDPA